MSDDRATTGIGKSQQIIQDIQRVDVAESRFIDPKKGRNQE
jgi:hypothetical protein